MRLRKLPTLTAALTVLVLALTPTAANAFVAMPGTPAPYGPDTLCSYDGTREDYEADPTPLDTADCYTLPHNQWSDTPAVFGSNDASYNLYSKTQPAAESIVSEGTIVSKEDPNDNAPYFYVAPDFATVPLFVESKAGLIYNFEAVASEDPTAAPEYVEPTFSIEKVQFVVDNNVIDRDASAGSTNDVKSASGTRELLATNGSTTPLTISSAKLTPATAPVDGSFTPGQYEWSIEGALPSPTFRITTDGRTNLVGFAGYVVVTVDKTVNGVTTTLTNAQPVLITSTYAYDLQNFIVDEAECAGLEICVGSSVLTWVTVPMDADYTQPQQPEQPVEPTEPTDPCVNVDDMGQGKSVLIVIEALANPCDPAVVEEPSTPPATIEAGDLTPNLILIGVVWGLGLAVFVTATYIIRSGRKESEQD